MDRDFSFGGEIRWRPAPADIERAHLTRFMAQHDIEDFATLLLRSTQEVGWFTEAVLQYLDIQFHTPYSKVIDLERGIAWPEWCVGGEMNIVHNCVDKYMGTTTEEQVAVLWEGEGGEIRSLSYGELFRQVNQVANALRSMGLGAGDAIGLYMPMVPEAAIALLAYRKAMEKRLGLQIEV